MGCWNRTRGTARRFWRRSRRRCPTPLDRFDVASLDRPLATATFTDRDDAHERVRTHIATDLHLRTSPERSAAQGVFLAALLSFLALAEIPAARWNERSRAESLPGRWHTFLSATSRAARPRIASRNSSPSRTAGILRFLGPEIDVRIEPQHGFVASSPQVPGSVAARSLVDAWLPGPGAAVSDNPVLRELAGRQGSGHRVLTDADGRVLTAVGAPTASVFALGPFTSLPEGGAFTPTELECPVDPSDRPHRRGGCSRHCYLGLG
ncbi:MAG: hypothetical protein PGN24_08390 [Microbacterium arborescens]